MNYELLKSDKKLNTIINSINEVNENYLFACHGRYHADFVVKNIEYLLTAINYSKDIIEIGKIAGLLHDIGVINGKKDHAHKSSEMCLEFLEKTNLSEENKNIIIHAIKDHSKGDEIKSPVGAALILIDKIDISKNRVLELGKKDPWTNNLLNIDEVILTVEDDNIIINYIANNKLDEQKLFAEYKKGITVPIKASKYFNCNCIFQINGKKIDLSKFQ